MWRVDFEIDGLPVDAFIGAGDPGCLILDFPLDVAKISEVAAGNVMEFGPLRAASLRGIPVCRVCVWLGLILLDVDQLQNQGSSGHDATASRKKISANNVLEYG